MRTVWPAGIPSNFGVILLPHYFDPLPVVAVVCHMASCDDVNTVWPAGIPGEISGMGFGGVSASSEDEATSDDLGSEEEEEESGSKDEEGSNFEINSEEEGRSSSDGEEGGKPGMLSKKTLHQLVRKVRLAWCG